VYDKLSDEIKGILTEMSNVNKIKLDEFKNKLFTCQNSSILVDYYYIKLWYKLKSQQTESDNFISQLNNILEKNNINNINKYDKCAFKIIIIMLYPSNKNSIRQIMNQHISKFSK
jgi:hypothetical protein